MAELDDSDTRENLIATIFNEMASDCDWQSRRLLRIYALGDAAQRDLIDDVLLCLCGWTFPTLLRKSEANR
jgi:hypothetical protein